MFQQETGLGEIEKIMTSADALKMKLLYTSLTLCKPPENGGL